MASISFVASASSANSSTNSSYSITKPSGITTGDFMIASVCSFPGDGQGQVTVTPPGGWTVLSDIFEDDGSYACQLTIMTRTATESEPGSWAGSYSGNQEIESITCVAYRGVTSVAVYETDSIGGATSYTVGSVANPSSSNWRIVIAGYTSGSVNYDIQSSEVRQRAHDWDDNGSDRGLESASWDSNGTVSVANHSRTVSRGAVWGTSCAWIGILDANDTAIPGDLAVTMPLPSVSMSGALSYDGVLAATMPIPSMSAAGIASPPAGTLDVVVLPSMSVAAAHHASGALSVVVPISIGVIGETRKFGIRVITPEAESRVTTPRLGAVD